MAAILTFTVDGMPSDALRPHSVIGVEALSTLYRFEVECLAANGRAMNPLDLVGRRATLRIQMDEAQPRSVFGIVEKLEIEPPSIFGDARYRFWLVPWLSRLKLSRSNQIHGTEDPVSVADVLTAELAGALRRNAQVADNDMRSFENDLRLQHTTRYPKRDHICQYEETDFAFVSRLAEHYGIFLSWATTC
jgi:type VI secretion system secreted protein VgrG